VGGLFISKADALCPGRMLAEIQARARLKLRSIRQECQSSESASHGDRAVASAQPGLGQTVPYWTDPGQTIPAQPCPGPTSHSSGCDVTRTAD
jgi:hypothetical protein